LAPTAEVWLKELLGRGEVADVRVVLKQFRDVIVHCQEVGGNDFDDTEDGSLLEIVDESLGLLRYGEIVAPREDARDEVLLL